MKPARRLSEPRRALLCFYIASRPAPPLSCWSVPGWVQQINTAPTSSRIILGLAVENSSTVDCRIVAKSSGIAFDLLAASRLRLVGCSISSVSSKGSVVGELDCVHKGWRHQEHNCSLFPSQIVTNPLQIVSREPFYAASNFGYVRCILQIGDWFYMTTELRFRVYSSLQTTTVLDNNKEIFARRARRAVSNL